MKNKLFSKQFKILKTGAIFAVFAIFALSPFVSCKSVPQKSNETFELQTESLVPADVHWEQIESGFEKTDFTVNTEKGKISWTCVKIDLNNPNLEFIVAPEKVSEKGELFTLKQFSKTNKTVVAVNTTPFDNNTKTYLPIGIVVNEKEIISVPVNRSDYAALAIYKKENHEFRAKVLCPQLSVYNSDLQYDYVSGGFFLILSQDQIVPHNSFRRSRTAAGINSDGTCLYLFATTPVFNFTDNNGLSYNECALILKHLGCSDALQFDGGHSTGLYIYSSSQEKPFMQRKIPAAFGIKVLNN